MSMPDASMELEQVWQPLTVGPHLLAHRIVTTPHGVAWGGTNIPFPRQIAYYAERARGGAALVQIGATSAWRRGADPDGPVPTTAADPRAIPLYAELAQAIHVHDCRVFVELAESGVHTTSRPAAGNWEPVLGASQLPSVVTNETPRVLDADLIAELRADYRTAMRNLVDAGIDGVSLHAAHSYLLGQFLSPAYNERTDGYGGSIDNRLRLIAELLESVHEAAAGALAIGLRISYDEFIGPAGITPELAEEYLARLLDRGLLDFIDVSAGGYHTGERYVPPNVLGETPIQHFGRRARDLAAGRAVVIMGHRVNTVASAERMLREGNADLVGIARGHIADPFLVAKARAGQAEQTVGCVGSNECVYTLHRGVGIACTVNPVAGREASWGHDATHRDATHRDATHRDATHREATSLPGPGKRVVVIGAGPAGLQAAAVAGRRGHQVTVLERDQEGGGSLRTLGRLPLQRSWRQLADDLTTRARAQGVELRFGVEASVSAVEALEPDVVIVATGSEWELTGRTPAVPTRPGIPGLEQHARVLAIDEAVSRAAADPAALGNHVLIVDETGSYLPLGAAELLSEAGVAVTIVSRRHMVGEIPKETWELPLVMRRLAGRPVELLPYTVLDSVDPGLVRIRDLWGGPVREITPVDTIVLCGLRLSRRSLYDQLRAGYGDRVRLIGDALAPRRPADATYDGELAGRAV